jgi:hypothetical protein
MSGVQILLAVIAVNGCVLGIAWSALYQLDKAVSQRGR